MKKHFEYLIPVFILISMGLLYENPAPIKQINFTQSENIDLSDYYIGNKNTKKFHVQSCSFLPYEENRIYFSLREDAIDNGFIPCQKCEP